MRRLRARSNGNTAGANAAVRSRTRASSLLPGPSVAKTISRGGGVMVLAQGNGRVAEGRDHGGEGERGFVRRRRPPAEAGAVRGRHAEGRVRRRDEGLGVGRKRATQPRPAHRGSLSGPAASPPAGPPPARP